MKKSEIIAIFVVAMVVAFISVKVRAQQASVELSWSCPTAYQDGSPMALTALDKTVVFWRKASEQAWQTAEFDAVVNGACVASHELSGLTAGDYHIGGAVVDVTGLVSDINTINFTHDGSLSIKPFPYPEMIEGLTADIVQSVERVTQCSTLTVKIRCKR